MTSSTLRWIGVGAAHSVCDLPAMICFLTPNHCERISRTAGAAACAPKPPDSIGRRHDDRSDRVGHVGDVPRLVGSAGELGGAGLAEDLLRERAHHVERGAALLLRGGVQAVADRLQVGLRDVDVARRLAGRSAAGLCRRGRRPAARRAGARSCRRSRSPRRRRRAAAAWRGSRPGRRRAMVLSPSSTGGSCRRRTRTRRGSSAVPGSGGAAWSRAHSACSRLRSSRQRGDGHGARDLAADVDPGRAAEAEAARPVLQRAAVRVRRRVGVQLRAEPVEERVDGDAGSPCRSETAPYEAPPAFLRTSAPSE